MNLDIGKSCRRNRTTYWGGKNNDRRVEEYEDKRTKKLKENEFND